MFRFYDHLRGVEVIRKDTQSKLSEKLFRLNKKFLKHTFKLLSIMFPKFFSLATALFVFLLIIVVSLELLVYQVGLLSGKFYFALSNKDFEKFRDLAILSVVMIIGNAFLKSLTDFLASLLRINWRKNLTLYLNKNYFENKNFYYLQIQTKKVAIVADFPANRSQSELPIYATNNNNNNFSSVDSSNAALLENNNTNSVTLDNPDQRITQDVDNLCSSVSTITPTFLISPFVICYYVYKVQFKKKKKLIKVKIYFFYLNRLTKLLVILVL